MRTVSPGWLSAFLPFGLLFGLWGCSRDRGLTLTPILPATTGDLQTAASRDSSQLAFVHYPGDSLLPGLYVLDLRSGTARHLTGEYTANPSWSPDGRSLAYSATGDFLLTVLRLGDLSATRLTTYAAACPTWSPAGDRLAYCAWRSGGQRSLRLMQADGTGAIDLCPRDSTEYLYPSWSPDGQRLLHTEWGPGMTQPEVVIMGVDGVGRQRLTSDGICDESPMWSSDGSRIVWVRLIGSTQSIWLMNIDGTNPHQLTVGRDPAWLGTQEIVYSSTIDGYAYSLRAIRPNGTGSHPITYHVLP